MLDDPRNSLVREFVRIVAELRASYFVFENVKGLTIGEHKGLLEELIEEFARRGYRTRLALEGFWMRRSSACRNTARG